MESDAYQTQDQRREAMEGLTKHVEERVRLNCVAEGKGYVFNGVLLEVDPYQSVRIFGREPFPYFWDGPYFWDSVNDVRIPFIGPLAIRDIYSREDGGALFGNPLIPENYDFGSIDEKEIDRLRVESFGADVVGDIGKLTEGDFKGFPEGFGRT